MDLVAWGVKHLEEQIKGSFGIASQTALPIYIFSMVVRAIGGDSENRLNSNAL
jgi:hypothetical protein